MNRKASISHDAAMIDELRRDPEFAAEYLKAALEDTEEPKVLLVVLRQLAEAKGGVAKIRAKALTDSQRSPAPQPGSATPPATTTPTPTVYAPQVLQTTVVQVVNKNTQRAYGCSDCSVFLLLILIGIVILILASTSTTP